MATDRIRYRWKFLFTAALPLLLAFVGVVLLTGKLVFQVSSGANAEDHARTRETVISALGAARQQLASLAADNAYWNDAVRHAYGEVNEPWLMETWGTVTEEHGIYDAVLLAERNRPDAIIGYVGGTRFAPLTNHYLSHKFGAMLGMLSGDSKPFQARSSILNTADGLAIVAAAPILPTSDGVAMPTDKRRFLILVKRLTPQYLAEMGKQYIIQDLKMAEIGAQDAGGEVITDFTRAPVAKVQWTDRRPGDTALGAVWHVAMISLGFLALALTAITLLCWRSLVSLLDAVKGEAGATEHAGMLKDLNHQITQLNMELVGKMKLLDEAREKRLREAKMVQLGSLVATIAHELRNPLNVIRTSSFLVRRKLQQSGIDLGPQLRRVETGIARCDVILSQLLDYSRSQLPNATDTDVDSWLENLLGEEGAKLPDDLTIKGNLTLQGCRTGMDQGRMARAVANLLANAAEAMFDKDMSRPEMRGRLPLIMVATKLTARGIEITVEDNGPGMSQELLAKIREPLFTTKSFGTGLGVPVVEKIVEQHGGGVDIGSVAGKGTRVTIWFPISQSAEPDQKAA